MGLKLSRNYLFLNSQTLQSLYFSNYAHLSFSQYKLVLVASDNLNENYTNVVIKVKGRFQFNQCLSFSLIVSYVGTQTLMLLDFHSIDVNDNPPIFDRPTYQATITEGDDKKLPKKILQVHHIDCIIDMQKPAILRTLSLLLASIPRLIVMKPIHLTQNLDVFNFACR